MAESPANPSPELEGPRGLPVLDGTRYVKFRLIGYGAMGIVYEAEDLHLHRSVAIKVCWPHQHGDRPPPSPLDMDLGAIPPDVAADAKRRFLVEAQITGSLNHPGITPVHEVGRTPRGVPYYVMRFVDAETTLSEALRATKSFEERRPLIDTFVRVCEVLQYAHGQRVIHRDLKPSNVVLTPFAEVFLLDWGTARHVESSGPPETILEGELRAQRAAGLYGTEGKALGTPGYLSPEGLLGQAVDPRSDLFSLGAMLFEILSGRLPFHVSTWGEYIDAIRADRPPLAHESDPKVPEALSRLSAWMLAARPDARPADVGEVIRVVREWERDLQTQALFEEARAAVTREDETQATRLLQRVASLHPGHPGAAALQRQIEEVRARVIARAERQARRRLVVRAGTALALVLAAVGVVVAIWMSERRKDAESAKAEETRTRAAAETLLRGNLYGLRDKLESIGKLDLLAQSVRDSIAYYEGLPEGRPTPEERRLHGVALNDLGQVLLKTGDPEGAEKAFTTQRRILERLLAEDGSFHKARGDLFVALSGLGDIEFRRKNHSAALALYEEAERTIRKVREAAPDDPETRTRLGAVLVKVSGVAKSLGQAERAATLAKEALDLAGAPLERARALKNRAELRSGDRPDAQALEDFERASELYRTLASERPDDLDLQLAAGRTDADYGNALADADRGAEAVQVLERAAATLERTSRASPAHLDVYVIWDVALSGLFTLRATANEWGETRKLLERSVAVQRLRLEHAPASDGVEASLASRLLTLGEMMEDAGDDAAAVRVVAAEAESRFRALAEKATEHVQALNLLARTHEATSDWEAAHPLFREAAERAAGLEDADTEEVLVARGDAEAGLGRVLVGLGRLSDAARHLKAAMETYERLAPLDPEDPYAVYGLRDAATELAGLRTLDGIPQEAIELHRRAIAAGERILVLSPEDGENRYLLAMSHEALATLLVSETASPFRDGPALREALAERARAVAQFQHVHEDHPEEPGFRAGFAQAQVLMAELLASAGRVDDALSLLQDARDVAKPITDEDLLEEYGLRPPLLDERQVRWTRLLQLLRGTVKPATASEDLAVARALLVQGAGTRAYGHFLAALQPGQLDGTVARDAYDEAAHAAVLAAAEDVSAAADMRRQAVRWLGLELEARRVALAALEADAGADATALADARSAIARRIDRIRADAEFTVLAADPEFAKILEAR